MEVEYHESTYISLDVAKGGFCFMFKTTKKRWYDLVLKVIPRKCGYYCFSVFNTQMLIAFSHYIKSNPTVH